jgi:hypothetical protein
MKRTIALLLLVVNVPIFTFAQNGGLKSEINENVELLSIVFRLAGNREYNTSNYKEYTCKVDEYFSPYRDHELIKYAKTLKIEKGISYDAVACMALALNKELNPKVRFSENLPEKRWDVKSATQFVRLLKQFYEDAKCKTFFKKNKQMYANAVSQFQTVAGKIDYNWFESFFGAKNKEQFRLVVSLGVGNHNYGPSSINEKGEKELYAVMGTWKFNEQGEPVYNEGNYLPVIIHEFCHSFVNPLLAKYNDDFRESGKQIFKAVEFEMTQAQAYGSWDIMLNEALVRAAVIQYYISKEANNKQLQAMVRNENKKGFIWIKGLVGELSNYQKQRSIYADLESYIPNLSKAYQQYATKITAFDARKPKVVSIDEFKNQATNVDANLKTITVNFDRALIGKGYSINYGRRGKNAFPKINNIKYVNGNKTVQISVELKPNKTYEMIFTGRNFKSKEGVGLKTYGVCFRTEK